jgi:hypothetical protein
MKNKGFFDREFHCRGPGDHAKAGKSRESIRAIVMRPATRCNPGAAGRRPAILASLGVVANDSSARSKNALGE